MIASNSKIFVYLLKLAKGELYSVLSLLRNIFNFL